MIKVVVNPLWKNAPFELEVKLPESSFKDPYPNRFLTEDAMQKACEAMLENDWNKFRKLRVEPFLMI